jgi:outer membrane lipoprotein-sorting protein
VTRHVHITSIQTNVPIDRTTFIFTIPKGVRVVDQTKPD